MTTASEIISFSKRLETESAAFYAAMAERYPPAASTLLGFASENSRHVAQIDQAYYGSITDVAESCFAFDIEDEDWVLGAMCAEAQSLLEAAAQAQALEDTIERFYAGASFQSKGLLAGVPRVFQTLAKKRRQRIGAIRFLAGAAADGLPRQG